MSLRLFVGDYRSQCESHSVAAVPGDYRLGGGTDMTSLPTCGICRYKGERIHPTIRRNKCQDFREETHSMRTNPLPRATQRLQCSRPYFQPPKRTMSEFLPSNSVELPPRRRRRRPKQLRACPRPELTVAWVLARADDHHARTGRWPKKTSGAATAHCKKPGALSIWPGSAAAAA
jgi:hypothetical protein